MTEEPLLAQFDVLGEPAKPADVAFKTAVSPALWLFEYCSWTVVGNAFESAMPAALSGPLWAELEKRRAV